MTEKPEEFVSTYEEPEFGSAIVRLWKTKPFVVTGVIGMIGACGYGYHRYKTKGFLVSPSLFLMQLRVGAQSTVIGCITIGMLYNMYTRHFAKQKEEN